MNNYIDILPSKESWSETRIQENTLSHPATIVQCHKAVLGRLKATGGGLMFQLTFKELNEWKSQIVISNKVNMGLRKLPLAFTEVK